MRILTVILPLLSSTSLDALENKLKFLEILAAVTFIGVPLFKILFGKKKDSDDQ